MRFAPAFIKDVDTGCVHDIFLPEPVKAGWHEDEISNVTEVMVGESEVTMPTHLLHRVIEFGLTNDERELRRRLGHDCLVFALACETGDSQVGVQFGTEFNQLVHVRNFDINVTPEDGFMGEPELDEGQIAFTANALPHNPDFLVPNKARMHFLVRAGSDEQGSIYLSKFGQLGPVVAHRLSTSLDYYPAQTVGQASGLSIGPAI